MINSSICKVNIVWVGKEVGPPVIKAKLRNDVTYYKKCICGPLTLRVGDFVLVSNADSADPDSEEGCDVAKIISMYNDDYDKEDPYRAIVQWFSRPHGLPSYTSTKNLKLDIEIVEDTRPFDADISLETIFNKCSVLYADLSENPREVLDSFGKSKFMYVCRYKLVHKTARKYELIGLNEEHVEESKTPKLRKNAKRQSVSLADSNLTPKRTKEDPLVSPIKIIGNSVQKIKRSNNDAPNVEIVSHFVKDSSTKEMNGNYLLESPKKENKRNSTGVRRNLNDCLNEAHKNVLDYSIINGNEADNALKIKLRLSQKYKNEEPKTPLRRSSRTSSISVDSTITLRRSSRSNSMYTDPIEITPAKAPLAPQTPKNKLIETPRIKSILKTPGSKSGTPRKTIKLMDTLEEDVEGDLNTVNNNISLTTTKSKSKENESTPRKKLNTTEPTTPKTSLTPHEKRKIATPSIEKRLAPIKYGKMDLEVARERLHVSAIPKSLPCRENEFSNIYNFIKGKLLDECGGCMYISGVPGTGKTATVSEVIRCLQQKVIDDIIPSFVYIDINGMRLTQPRQAYVHIYRQLTGKTVPWEQAHSLLEKRFTTPAPRRQTTVLLVDELDILCNRRQDVVYNLLDWPTKSAAKLVVVTIANTMDLPERLLMGKVASRLGLTRLTFQPYSHKQLQEIVTSRLIGVDAFKGDAVQLVARKVAAVSGDARRALDICRRSTEIAEQTSAGKKSIVSMANVQQALTEMISSAKILAIKSCSKMEKLFLQAVTAEIERTGVEETTFAGVYTQLETLSSFLDVKLPPPGCALRICSKLGAFRLLICEHSRADLSQKILLNISCDDIHYALQLTHS